MTEQDLLLLHEAEELLEHLRSPDKKSWNSKTVRKKLKQCGIIIQSLSDRVRDLDMEKMINVHRCEYLQLKLNASDLGEGAVALTQAFESGILQGRREIERQYFKEE